MPVSLLAAGFAPRNPELNPGRFHVGSVVGKAVLSQVSLRTLPFLPANYHTTKSALFHVLQGDY